MAIQCAPAKRRCAEEISNFVRSVLRAAAVVVASSALLIGSNVRAGEVAATVIPVLPSVSLSLIGSETAASFKVVVTNNDSTSAKITGARLVGSTTVTNGEAAVFRSSTVYSCSGAGTTSIDCAIGALGPGESSQEFVVTFAAPTAGSNIAFEWRVLFDQGVPPGNSNGDGNTANIALAPRDDSNVVSAVAADLQLVVFTGSGVATPTDTWVTRVRVPASAIATTAAISESLNNQFCSRAGDLLTCGTSNLTIPNATFGTAGGRPLSQFLEITLLRDSSTISKSAKIGSARVYYRKIETSLPEEVLACTDTTWGPLPQAGRPCEDKTQRLEFPRKNSARTPVAQDYESDWRFVIYAFDNGSYDQ